MPLIRRVPYYVTINYVLFFTLVFASSDIHARRNPFTPPPLTAPATSPVTTPPDTKKNCAVSACIYDDTHEQERHITFTINSTGGLVSQCKIAKKSPST